MDRLGWVFILILCFSITQLVQGVCLSDNKTSVLDPQSCAYNTLKLAEKRPTINPVTAETSAIVVGWSDANKCCTYVYTEGKCYDASTYRLANRRVHGCDILNIDKWKSVNFNLYHSFQVKATRNENEIQFSALPCNVADTCLAETTTTNPTTTADSAAFLSDTIASLNPDSTDDLEKIENLIRRKVTEGQNLTADYGNAQLHIEIVKNNQSEYNSNLQLGSTHIDFTLQTNEKRLVTAALVFRINTTKTAQTQPAEASSLATTRYIATVNTPYIAIGGWDADGTDEPIHPLQGQATIVGSLTSPESVCKEIDAEKKNTGNLMINKVEPLCLFFDKVERKYSDHGCVTITDDLTGNVTCKCNHLTLFTVLLAVQSIKIPKGVTVTSYTTKSASIVFLFATIIILHKSKHSGDRVPAQISLSLALLLLHVVNISHNLAVLNEVACVVHTAFNQYMLLCSGMWFLVEGIRLFMATSFPFEFHNQNSSNRLKIFMLIGWIIPAFLVCLSIAVGLPLGIYMKPQPLFKQCNEFIPILKYDRCWLTPGTPIFYSTVVAPLALIILINFMIVLKTTHVMLNSKKVQNRGEDAVRDDALSAARCFILLFFMLGGTWIFAFFTGIGNNISNEIFMYIHNVLNGSQGIVVFLLYCVMNGDLRQEMLTCKRKADVASELQENEANPEGGESLNPIGGESSIEHQGESARRLSNFA